MTQEDKDLLLKDICARLPYGVKLQNINDIESIVKLRYIDLDDYCCEIVFYSYQGEALTICNKSKLFRFGNILRYKPYLFPMSSMTNKQKEEYHYIVNYISPDDTENWTEGEFVYVNQTEQLLHFCHTNHLDYRGLIEKGLALDATNKNIY